MRHPVPVPQELLDFIKNSQKFLIVGHKEPDGDCVGSQLALSSVLQRLGKEVILCSAGPFKRTEIRPYQNYFISKTGEKERKNASVILIDCSAMYRTGYIASELENLPTAVIDHHASNEHKVGTSKEPVYLDPGAPSVTFMILALIEALGLQPTKEEAEFLLFGLCTDTGFFRHVDENGAATFQYASRLLQAGASPKETFQRINGGKTFNSRILLGILLARTKTYFDGKLALTFEEYEETQRLGLESRDSDTLYQLLQSITGVEAIVCIRQETAQNCTVGLRSKDKIDVAAIAAAFGGGGHKNAAGFIITGTITQILPQIIESFGTIWAPS